MSVTILDSATHPTISGKWISGEYDCSFESLHYELTTHEFLGACAIGLPGVGDYEHRAFLKACKEYPELIPVAGISPIPFHDGNSDHLGHLASMGYCGVKLHPRLAGFDIFEHESQIVNTLARAADAGLVVFFCTYFPSVLSKHPAGDPLLQLIRILKQASGTKIVLMHGGTVRLLEYADLARFNDNILLDLSYTIIKYLGSSIELDVRYLFRTLDHKICIGSDHPEFSPANLVETFLNLTSDLPIQKLKNIGYQNLLRFLDIPIPASDGPARSHQ